MRLVILESPYAGDVSGNVDYARAAMRECLLRGDAPFVSHLLYTQCLDDLDPHERRLGINSGLSWGCVAQATVVYFDRGISRGMLMGIEHADQHERPIEFRRLGISGIYSRDEALDIVARETRVA